MQHYSLQGYLIGIGALAQREHVLWKMWLGGGIQCESQGQIITFMYYIRMQLRSHTELSSNKA